MNSISCDVAIIGAGLAGLAATDYLVKKGMDAQLFEAQSRAGGRVFTRHTSSGQHYEEGAFSFTDGETTLWKYINCFSLEVIQHSQIDKKFHFKGITSSFSDTADFLKGVEKGIKLNNLLAYYLTRMEIQEEDESIANSLRRLGASEEVIQWLADNTLIGLLGNSIEDVSALSMQHFLDQYSTSTKIFSLKGGNDNLPKALAKDLGKHIHFNFKIEKIEQFASSLILEGPQRIYAKKVIFAIPLPALQQIEITPPLPKEKQEALLAIPYTSSSRVTFLGNSSIFEKVQGGVFATSNAPTGWFRNQTLFQNNPDTSTVFNLSCVGKKAREISKKSKIERDKPILERLKSFMPNVKTEGLESNFYAWDEVEGLHGGYAYYPPGKFLLQKVLARPVENLYFFTGEHTTEKFASMNGALESGRRAAQEVLLS